MTTTDTLPAVIGLEHVQALGNVDESLASFYDSSVAAAATEAVSEREIRDWIEYDLISEQGFRSQVLEGPGQSGAAVLLALENAYLIRSDMRRGAQWFELSHDRLVGPVRDSNAAWRIANLDPLQVNSMAWVRQGRPDALLAAGPALVAARTWAEANPDALLPADEEFLAESEAHEAGLLVAKKATRRNRILAGVALALALLAIIGGAVAYNANENSKELRAARIEAEAQKESAVLSAEEAEQQRLEAEESAQIAAEKEAEAREQRSAAQDSEATALEQQALAEESAEEAAFARGLAEDSEQEARRQQQLAEESAAEAEVQRQLAEESAAEAARLQQLAEDNAAEAARQRSIAESNASKARQQQQLAEANAAEAARNQQLAEANAAEANQLRLKTEELAATAKVRAECVYSLVFSFSTAAGQRIRNEAGQGDDTALLEYADFLIGSIPAQFDPDIVCPSGF